MEFWTSRVHIHADKVKNRVLSRHRIENVFAKIKEFRMIATRYDKTASNFAARIHLVAEIIAAR